MRMADRVLDVTRAHAPGSTALVSGILTFVLYLPGASRGYGYDGAVTVANFVVTPSLLDPFRRQIVYNNHVFFSFLEHVVYSVTGTRSEFAFRLLPITAGAAAVALLVWAVATRTGILGGLTAGALLGANPMFVELSREVRGYSLMILCAVGSSILFARLLGGGRRFESAAYVLVTAVGLATYVHMAAVLAIHVAIVWRRHALSEWRARWLTALFLGGLAYVRIGPLMLDASAGRVFRPRFPADLATHLFGATRFSSALVLGLVAGSVVLLWRSGDLRAAAVGALVTFCCFWVALAPPILEIRFFLWAVPAAAVLSAYAVSRWPALLVLVACFVAISVHAVAPRYTDDGGSYREAAAIVDRVDREGGRACAVGANSGPLYAYTDRFAIVTRLRDVNDCDVLAWVSPTLDAGFVSAAATKFPFERRVAAGGRVFCTQATWCASAAKRMAARR